MPWESIDDSEDIFIGTISDSNATVLISSKRVDVVLPQCIHCAGSASSKFVLLTCQHCGRPYHNECSDVHGSLPGQASWCSKHLERLPVRHHRNLLDLPQEVCDIIYSYLGLSSRNVPPLEYDEGWKLTIRTAQDSPVHALSQTCRRTRDNIGSFIRRYTRTMTIRWSTCTRLGHPIMAEKFLKHLAQEHQNDPEGKFNKLFVRGGPDPFQSEEPYYGNPLVAGIVKQKGCKFVTAKCRTQRGYIQKSLSPTRILRMRRARSPKIERGPSLDLDSPCARRALAELEWKRMAKSRAHSSRS